MTSPRLIKLVHMGDSITFGECVDASLRWTSLIARRLDAIYRAVPVHIMSWNRGISGETTRQGLERFPADVQLMRPDIVTIQFGLNDCNCWLTDEGLPRVSADAFAANLAEMIERSRRFGAHDVIVANNHPTLRTKVMLSGERYEDANARYSEITRGVALRSDATFCDIRNAFSGYSPSALERLLAPYPDQLHLSVEGNAVYADAIWPFIEAAVRARVGDRTTLADV